MAKVNYPRSRAGASRSKQLPLRGLAILLFLILDVSLDHIIGDFVARCANIVSSGPQVASPQHSLDGGEALEELGGRNALDLIHDLTGSVSRRRRQEQVDMVFGDSHFIDGKAIPLGDAVDQLLQLLSDFRLEQHLPVLGDPDKVVLDIVADVGSFSNWHDPVLPLVIQDNPGRTECQSRKGGIASRGYCPLTIPKKDGIPPPLTSGGILPYFS